MEDKKKSKKIEKTKKPPTSNSEHWAHLLSPQRLDYHSNKKNKDTTRSPFHKDYDRVIFSQSFRQLNQKTQVHPLTNEMGIHTRLTHSLEVSCIGRSLGMMTAERLQGSLDGGLPSGVSQADVGAIVQAACLAHDIGNPPFGHAGEYAIRDWFNTATGHLLLSKLTAERQLDLLGYEGNAQGFRLLVRNEQHPNAGGMRLTSATLGAFMKYPYCVQHSNQDLLIQNSEKINIVNVKKYGCFNSEHESLMQLADQIKLPKSTTHDGFSRHPLAYLLEAADDICYALIDLEDGIQLGMIDYRDVEPLLLNIIGKKRGALAEHNKNAPITQKLAALRGRAMMTLVDDVSKAFANNADAMLAGELTGNLFEYCDKNIYESISAAKTIARKQIFNHPNKVKIELMASRCLHSLLDAFMPLALTNQSNDDKTPLSFEQQRLLILLEPHLLNLNYQLSETDIYQNILVVLDFITGMNDHEAYRLSQNLQGNWSKML